MSQCQWYRENEYKWMTDDQFECLEMLSDLCGGMHHVGGTVKPCGRGILINLSYGFSAATVDFNGLTKAVLMAHQRCIRFEICPSGPRMLQLRFHKRHQRDGDLCLRHPTIETAISEHIKYWPDKKLESENV